MKISKKIIVIGTISMSLIFSVGCSSRSTDVNSVGADVIDKLPKDQKGLEIDKELARIRKSRKESYTNENGSMTMGGENGYGLPGQSKNIPDFSDEGEELQKVISDYIEKELKVPKRSSYEYDAVQTLDPRMNAIYDDDDKGVADGYDNENIYIAEYETEKDDVYSYLILVRESKSSPWKAIHHGNSYKE